MMTSRSWIGALVLIIAVSDWVAGCGAPGSRQQAGTGIGAVAGGLVGSAIGRSLDEEERRQLALASEMAAEQPVVKLSLIHI